MSLNIVLNIALSLVIVYAVVNVTTFLNKKSHLFFNRNVDFFLKKRMFQFMKMLEYVHPLCVIPMILYFDLDIMEQLFSIDDITKQISFTWNPITLVSHSFFLTTIQLMGMNIVIVKYIKAGGTLFSWESKERKAEKEARLLSTTIIEHLKTLSPAERETLKAPLDRLLNSDYEIIEDETKNTFLISGAEKWLPILERVETMDFLFKYIENEEGIIKIKEKILGKFEYLRFNTVGCIRAGKEWKGFLKENKGFCYHFPVRA